MLLPSATSAEAVSENELKVAFLYNFALYSGWPKGSVQENAQQMTICTLVSDNLGDVLKQLENRRIRNKPLAIHRGVALKDAHECHLLYVPKTEQAQMQKILVELEEHSVLIVSDFEVNMPPRAAINMMLDKNKLVFEVDMRMANQAKITMSSKLLNLAKQVH